LAEILKGADVVAALNEKMTAEVTALKESGITPTLAILRVGERPDEISYETGATKRCATVGVAVKHVLLPENIDQATLLSAVEDLNADDNVHGVLILFPLPKHIDGEAVRNALNPKKDVDGITDISVAGVFTGASHKGFAPCTPHACMEILDYYGVDCTGKKAVVIGRSLVVGKPAAMMLLAKNATITVCHTKTVDMPAIVRDADIIIVAAGKMNAITAEYFSPRSDGHRRGHQLERGREEALR
jgi:methylenetetrahydrofolate dehydrogenase (NADP+) / methenyltetrahydrofolate cyclohydrolase